MTDHGLLHGVPLGAAKPLLPERTTYIVAQVGVTEGGENIGDATHMLTIELPVQGKEIRIPMNAAALRDLGRKLSRAGGIAQPAIDQDSENTR